MMPYGVFRASEWKRCVALKTLNLVICMANGIRGLHKHHSCISKFIWAKIILKGLLLEVNIVDIFSSRVCIISFLGPLLFSKWYYYDYHCNKLPSASLLSYREHNGGIGEGTSLPCNVRRYEEQWWSQTERGPLASNYSPALAWGRTATCGWFLVP